MQSQTSHNGQIRGSGSGGKPNPAEPNRYYFHPDHLGSTSYITDATGEVYQHLEYFAFGETFVEERSNTDRTPYLYNGKELDEETGLYYYGARYYDAQTSVWVSVDPLAEKYPGLSGYNYTLNNPVIFNDPTGLTPEKPPLKDRIKVFFGIGHWGVQKRKINGKVIADNRVWRPNVKKEKSRNSPSVPLAPTNTVTDQNTQSLTTLIPLSITPPQIDFNYDLSRVKIPPCHSWSGNVNIGFNTSYRGQNLDSQGKISRPGTPADGQTPDWNWNRGLTFSNQSFVNSQINSIVSNWEVCNSSVVITMNMPWQSNYTNQAAYGGRNDHQLNIQRGVVVKRLLIRSGIPSGAFDSGGAWLFINYNSGGSAGSPSGATVPVSIKIR